MTDVAVDACCLINLLAANCVLPKPPLQKVNPKGSHRTHELTSLGLVLHVPAVVASETLYILGPDHNDPAKLRKSPIDLDPYFTDGILQPCDVEGEDETAFFVGFANRLDDGEAACLAIAKNRNWLLATDDILATTLAVRQGVVVLTTAELLKRWATNTKVTEQEIAAAIQSIQRFARFVPRSNSPEVAWWLSHLQNE
ncbi:MAG: hypothetical protein WD872_06085 [Pirellulaceae bacterium]